MQVTLGKRERFSQCKSIQKECKTDIATAAIGGLESAEEDHKGENPSDLEV